MGSTPHKHLIIGAIAYHFDGSLQQVVDVGGGQGKAPPAIVAIEACLVNAAQRVDARVYEDVTLAPRLLEPGVDLAYRPMVVKDPGRDDEWWAMLAVGLEDLDEHSLKIVLSHIPGHMKAERLPGVSWCLWSARPRLSRCAGSARLPAKHTWL